MSLKIWLPLDGDLRNQGCSDVEVTNNGATINNSGKIGKCYSFTNNNIVIPSTNFKNDFTNNQASLTVWVKVSTNHSGYAQALVLGTQGTSWNNILFGIDINGSGIPIANVSTGSANTTLSFGTAIKDGTWHHLTSTYNNGTITVYLDGIQKNTGTTSNTPAWANSTNLYIGGNSGGEKFAHGDLMNDVRLYNHCLSAAEVYEISKGLILHYPLQGLLANNLGNPNLLYNSNKYYTQTSANTTVRTDAFYVYSSEYPNLINKTVTFSYERYRPEGEAENIGSGGTASRFGCHCSINWKNSSTNATTTQYPMITKLNMTDITDPRQRVSSTYTITPPNGYDTITNFNVAMQLTSRPTDNQVWFIGYPKLEYGSVATEWCENNSETALPLDTIFDCSGYGHHGTIINNVSTKTDTTRYNTCTYISATNQKIQISNLTTSGFGNSYSFSWWSNCSSFSGKMQWGFADGIRLNAIFNGNLWNTGDSSNNPLYIPGTTTQVTAPTTGVWHYWVMTGDGTTCKVYQDGELWATAKTYKSISGTTIYINGWNDAENYCNSWLLISDFRIYCTPLLDNDVKLLYNTGMMIDNLNKLHTYKINENVEKSITKTGIYNSPMLIEEGYQLNSATSFSYKPAANTNNSTSQGIGVVDLSMFAKSGLPVTVLISFDLSWSNFAFTSNESARFILQGANRKIEDGTNVWTGINYILNSNINFTTDLKSSTSGSTSYSQTRTIPASFFDTYDGSEFAARCDYSNGNGTITVSNIKIQVIDTTKQVKIKSAYTEADNFIEL